MSYTYTRNAAQCPLPLGPTSFALGNGATGPFASGMVVGSTEVLDQIAAILVLLAGHGGGAYGVISGLDVSQTTGLNVGVSAGIAATTAILGGTTSGLLEITGITTPQAPYQKPIPTAITLPDNSTSFVWLTSAGALVYGATIAPPVAATVFLATVTTAGGTVTNIDYSGRMLVINGERVRITADLFAPTDTPASTVRFHTVTGGGSGPKFYWDGLGHKQLVDMAKQLPSPTKTVLGSDPSIVAGVYTVQPTDPNTLIIIPTTADIVVKFQAVGNYPPGFTLSVLHGGTAHNVTVEDDSANVLTSAAITTGHTSPIAGPIPNGTGGTKWPSSGSLVPAMATAMSAG